MKLNAKQLRSGEKDSGQARMTVKKNEIYIILDNVLDTYNIGSIFRLADAVAAKQVILCGGTATPPNPRIKKASINTTEWVDWGYSNSAIEAIKLLRKEVSQIQVIAIEQTDRSVPYNEFEYRLPLLLVVGNETTGISKEVLALCDAVVEIPMFGVNKSLNVMVSLGIVLYKIFEKTPGSIDR